MKHARRQAHLKMCLVQVQPNAFCYFEMCSFNTFAILPFKKGTVIRATHVFGTLRETVQTLALFTR